MSAGTVIDGVPSLIGKNVFCLYPHQDRYTVPEAAITVLPDDVPLSRGVLAANMETAVNVLWDAEVEQGQSMSVIGGGVVGSLIAYTGARHFGLDVELVDSDLSKSVIYQNIGVKSSLPESACPNRDIVIHTSATDEGLGLALQLARTEGKIVEASWFGDRSVSIPLGRDFHSRRLQIVSSQVGMIAPSKRATHSFQDRMNYAVSLLKDEVLDALFTHDIDFSNLPSEMPKFAQSSKGVCAVRVRY